MKKMAVLTLCILLMSAFAFSTVYTIQNNYLGVNFADDSFEFNMGTSASYSLPNNALTFYYPYTATAALETTHSVVKVDGAALYDFNDTTDCPVDSGSVINGGTYISGSKKINGVIDANFRLEIVNNPALGSPADTVKIKYTLTNVSSATHTVAVRLELDTMVVDQDGAIISIDNGFTTLTTTTAWYKSLRQIRPTGGILTSTRQKARRRSSAGDTRMTIRTMSRQRTGHHGNSQLEKCKRQRAVDP